MAGQPVTIEPRPSALLQSTAGHLDRARVAGTTLPDLVSWRDRWADHYERVRGVSVRAGRPYYYREIMLRLAQLVEPGSRVLDIGCGAGDLLNHLRPARGVGVDVNRQAITAAREAYPHLDFRWLPAESVHQLGETFDYVVICQTLGEIYDLGTLFKSIQHVCHRGTRLIVVHWSRVWQPAVRLAEWIRIKPPTPEQNWVPVDEVKHLLDLHDFQTVRTIGMTLAPLRVPLVSHLCNRFLANLPGANQLGLNYIIIARPAQTDLLDQSRPRSVSVIVPARNEAGHVRPLLDRIPRMAPRQEVIFVEGHSTDDTWQAIRQAATQYQGPFEIKIMQQDGKGKGDAVRKGFAAATGDVLMILDADISVPPEELKSFYDAIASGRGELINGSRMVYLMDKRAMRFLNLLANKLFGWLFTWLLNQRFRDTLCGTKVLRREDYERIAKNRSFFGEFDPFGDFDLLFGAARLSMKIMDLPVHYKARTYGETNISRFRHGWMLLRMCAFAARKLKFV